MFVIVIAYNATPVAGTFLIAEDDRDAIAQSLDWVAHGAPSEVDGWRAFEYREGWGPGREIKPDDADYEPRRNDLSDLVARDEARQRDIGQATWAIEDDDVPHMAQHIAALPEDVRVMVMDALQVRAMDFVQDRLKHNDGSADLAADVYRTLDPGADSNNAFDPDKYGVEPLSEAVLLIEQLKLQREARWQELQERSGSSVELATMIENLDDQIARLESEGTTVNPDQEALA